jgi:hypothetical protein
LPAARYGLNKGENGVVVGSRKVRKNEAARREEREPVSEKARRTRTLRDLPNYTEPHDERATNPVIRLTQRVTALPPPLSPDDDASEHSLDALALLARRSSPPPRGPVVQRLVAPVAHPSVHPQAVVAAKPSSIPAMTVSGSSPPPAGASVTTSPPRRRSTDTGVRARALGTVILSATVGAVVALGMWGVRSGLDRAGRTSDPSRPVAALGMATAEGADKCPSPAPAAASPASGSAPAPVSATSTQESEPRPVSIDTLPVAHGFGPTVPARSTRAGARRSATATTTSASFASSSSDDAAPEPKPVVHRAPAAPVSPRAAVAAAVQRASFAARSCESGPQSGKVEVTFAPSGAVSSVSLIKGFDDVGVNGCVLRAFGRVRSAPFEGDPVTVRKTVSW